METPPTPEERSDKTDQRSSKISLLGLLSRFRWKISLTLALVGLEAILDLFFPLFIGIAINGILEDSYTGILQLAALGLALLTIGSARRFYDTRAYAAAYEVTATELVEREQQKDTSISAVSARTSLLSELVEFFENSMPIIVTTVISLVGTLIVIASLSVEVFLASLGLLALTMIVYWLTGDRNFRLNKGYNDQLEQQVEALSSRDTGVVRKHFKALMAWNIRLSDLETLNYIAIWLGVIALLVYAPIVVVDRSEGAYGFVFSILLYVFQFIEGLATLPLFIQQIIRLQEISGRLSE